jgi:hypothetical protein
MCSPGKSAASDGELLSISRHGVDRSIKSGLGQREHPNSSPRSEKSPSRRCLSYRESELDSIPFSACFEPLRICDGRELPSAEVSRKDLLGDGRLRDPPHGGLDAEPLSGLDGKMESDLDSRRTDRRITVLV